MSKGDDCGGVDRGDGRRDDSGDDRMQKVWHANVKGGTVDKNQLCVAAKSPQIGASQPPRQYIPVCGMQRLRQG